MVKLIRLKNKLRCRETSQTNIGEQRGVAALKFFFFFFG